VAQGSLSPTDVITATTELFAFKAQTRTVRTQEAAQATDSDTGSCPAEDEKNEDEDFSFQLLVVGQGPATIAWIRAAGQSTEENNDGDPDACEDEPEFNAVRFDGVGVTSTDEADLAAELAARVLQRFTSNQTAVVTNQGITEVGVGHAESIISQRAADRVAQIIAVRRGNNEIVKLLPPIISIGLES
jgi:hypothetical protein